MNDIEKWKVVILSRYLGTFQPAADEEDATIRKSSEDIQADLSEMGDFSINEISIELVAREYKVTIDEDGKPRWLMKKDYNSARQIENK